MFMNIMMHEEVVKVISVFSEIKSVTYHTYCTERESKTLSGIPVCTMMVL